MLKKLAGHTVIYGLSSILGRFLNYLLVPFYTAVFQPDVYGIVTEVYAYAAALNVLYLYGLETAYFRFSKHNESAAFSTAFTSVLLTSLVFSLSIFLLSDQIASALKYEGQEHFFQWLSVILAIDAIVAIPFARLRQQDKAVTFASFKLINIGLNIGLNLFFILLLPAVVGTPQDVSYVFISNAIANATYLIFFAKDFIKYQLKVTPALLKQMLNYCWPFLIIGFMGITNEMFSRAILKYRLPEGFYPGYTNMDMLGIFGACYKLSIFMTLAVQAFRFAFEPFLFSISDKKEAPETYALVMKWFIIFTCFSWIAISVFLPFIAPLFLRQDAYLKALEIVPWLLGGGVFLGVYYNLSVWYKVTDHTAYGAIISSIGVCFTILLNWIMIPYLGYIGSAITTFTTFLVMSIISYLWGKRVYPVDYSVKSLLFYLVVAGFFILFHDLIMPGIGSAFLLLLIYLTLVLILEYKTITTFLK